MSCDATEPALDCNLVARRRRGRARLHAARRAKMNLRTLRSALFPVAGTFTILCLSIAAAANLIWEIAQLPLYTIWNEVLARWDGRFGVPNKTRGAAPKTRTRFARRTGPPERSCAPPVIAVRGHGAEGIQ